MILAKVLTGDDALMLELFPAIEFDSMTVLEKDMRDNPENYGRGTQYTLVERKPTLLFDKVERTNITKGELYAE